MFDYLFSLFSNDMGIDLGTANTLVYVKNHGIVLREPSVVAIDKETRRVLAIGAEAKRMLGRTPSSIIAVRPLKNGVIADFEVTQEMIKFFIQKVHNRRSLLHPRIVIGIPSGITLSWENGLLAAKPALALPSDFQYVFQFTQAEEPMIYQFEVLLTPELWADHEFSVEAEDLPGEYRVIQGAHDCDGRDFLTSLRVAKVG